MDIAELLPILQTAIGPVIVISGVGLLLLSMTNRFGRIIDRTRILCEALRQTGETEHHHITRQLDVLAKRASIVRLAILCASVSLLLAAILVIALFFLALLHANYILFLAALFILCMICLIASLILFVMDINLSLRAFHVELEHALRYAKTEGSSQS